MKVSILVTTYNLEKYIASTLRTILEQEADFDFEILVGDDGSSDRTRDIVEEYISRYPDRIRMYVMPRDVEPGQEINLVERSAANRLNLLKYARGAYISFLDGDDFYTDSHRLARMVSVLDDANNQDCIMCAHNLVMYYEDDTPFDEQVDGQRLCRAVREHKWTASDYWPLEFIQVGAMMFRNIYSFASPGYVTLQDLFSNVSGLAKNFDDNNITYSFLSQGKMFYIPESLGAYRQVKGSSWNSNDELKKAASNMIGATIEGYLDHYLGIDNGNLSYARHYKDYKVFLENKEQLSVNKCMPFAKTASECDLLFALSIYKLNDEETSDMDWVIFSQLCKDSELLYKKYKSRRVIKKLFKKF